MTTTRECCAPKLKRELGEAQSLVSYGGSPASVHRNHAPTPTSPDLAPACAPTSPTAVPAVVPIIAPTTVPTRVPTRPPSSCVSIPSSGAGKAQAHANTRSRNGRSAPTPTTTAPACSRDTSVPAATAPPASNDPDAMKAAAAEAGPRRGVGGNECRTEGSDDQYDECFPEHEDLPSPKTH